MDIKSLVISQPSRDFVKYMHKVLDINFYSTAYSNLMGFSISGSQFQFKNYYELKEIPSDELLAEYLPEIESFKMVTQFWDKTLKFGLVLGNKIDGVNETRYFHVKFGGLTKFVMMPKPPALMVLLKNKHPNAGMSYEYTNGVLTKKYYLYIEDFDDMSKILKLYNIKEEPSELEHLECYYTVDGDFKVNLIYLRNPLSLPEMAHLDPETRTTYAKIAQFLFDYKRLIWYIGVTKSQKFSVYFTTTDDKDFIDKLCE